MPRLVVVAAPLLAEGVRTALRRCAEWHVRIGSTADDADAWIEVGAEITVRGIAGASAVLGADTAAGRLRAAVAAVLEGLSVRDTPGFAGAPAFASTPDHEPLTPRELEVFELLAKGLTNRDIAGVLGISAHTAKYHVGQILAKTGAATRAEAVGEGLRSGLIGL